MPGSVFDGVNPKILSMAAVAFCLILFVLLTYWSLVILILECRMAFEIVTMDQCVFNNFSRAVMFGAYDVVNNLLYMLCTQSGCAFQSST